MNQTQAKPAQDTIRDMAGLVDDMSHIRDLIPSTWRRYTSPLGVGGTRATCARGKFSNLFLMRKAKTLNPHNREIRLKTH